MAVQTAPRWRARVERAWTLADRAGLQEIVLVLVAFLIYFYIRGLVVGRESEAIARGLDLIRFERDLGFYWELEMQSWILNHYWAIKTMNWVYFYGHMPLVIISAFWLYIWHRRAYRLSRNAFLASGAIGVVMYALWPVAPPRLIPDAGFIDTMAVYDRVGYNAQETEAFVNPYAALPSLHFGWSLLLGIVVFQVTKFPALKVLAVVWPVAMFFAIVMTGNHFIIDAIVGAVVSFAGFGIALGWERIWPEVAARARERWAVHRGAPG
jgi:hypothetical protein